MAKMGDLTSAKLATILHKITLPNGWAVRSMRKGDGFLLQIVFDAADSVTGEMREQRCRKWYVSSWASKSEIVRTVYKAGLAALEHEFDETFKYCGTAIYNPHLSVSGLAGVVASVVGEDRRDG